MSILYNLALFPVKSVINSLQILERTTMGAGHKIEPVVHESNEKVIFSNKKRTIEKKRGMNLLKDSKVCESEDCSDIKILVSDCSDDIVEIDDCLHVDDEEVDNFISTEINEKTLQTFLQREMDFYTKAFPQGTLSRRSSTNSSRRSSGPSSRRSSGSST